MSNNKQSMKLYTEEQLTRYLLDEGIIELSDLANNLIPHIELPSDEEILKRYIFYIDTEIQLGFLEESQGARLKWYYTKYFSNKIQGGEQ